MGLWVSGSNTVEQKHDALAAFQRANAKSNAYAQEHSDEALQAGLDFADSKLKVEDLVLINWYTELDPEDLDRTSQKMVDLGFLDAPVDLSGVIFEGGKG